MEMERRAEQSRKVISQRKLVLFVVILCNFVIKTLMDYGCLSVPTSQKSAAL